MSVISGLQSNPSSAYFKKMTLYFFSSMKQSWREFKRLLPDYYKKRRQVLRSNDPHLKIRQGKAKSEKRKKVRKRKKYITVIIR